MSPTDTTERGSRGSVPIAPMTGDIKLGPDKRAPDAAASYSEAVERFCLLELGAVEFCGTIELEYGGNGLGVPGAWAVDCAVDGFEGWPELLGPWATEGVGVRPEDRLV